MSEKRNLKISLSLFFILIVVVGGFWFISRTDAFSPPPGPPGQFTGSALKTNGTNFAIGTDVRADSRLTIDGGSTLGLIVLDSNSNPLLEVGPFDVHIGNPTGETASGGWASLRVTGIRASSTQLGDLYAQNAEVYGDLIGLPGSSIYGFTTIEADNISSTFSADNVAGGIFPAGTFAFGEPAYVGVGMSSNSGQLATLHVNGTGYFSGNVGIGTPPPSIGPGSLNIASGNNYWIIGFNKGIRLEDNSAIEFGGGTTGSGGILYGIGASSSRLYIFNTNTELNTALSPSFYNLTLGSSGVGVGIGATNPSATLHVSGTLKISGASGFQVDSISDVTGYVLTADSSGNGTWQPTGGIGVGGSGNTARYNGSSWIASSLLHNDGTFIGVSTTVQTPDTLLRVGSGGYLQLDKSFTATSPTASDCDNSGEQGRITYGTNASGDYFFYVCISNSWRAVKLNQ